MKYWAIMCLDTGRYLGGNGRGGTWREFDEDRAPRLFKTKTSALNALRWWLQGPGHRSYHGFDIEDSDDFVQSSAELAVGRQRQARADRVKVVGVFVGLTGEQA